VGQLGLFARRSVKSAALVVASMLDEGEQVEVLVAGRFRGDDGIAVVTARRVVVVNDREWKPEVEIIDIGPALSVQGWQDDRTASLLFEDGARSVAIEQIAERELAQRMAGVVRSRAADGA
jgi:hypothetical protein